MRDAGSAIPQTESHCRETDEPDRLRLGHYELIARFAIGSDECLRERRRDALLLELEIGDTGGHLIDKVSSEGSVDRGDRRLVFRPPSGSNDRHTVQPIPSRPVARATVWSYRQSQAPAGNGRPLRRSLCKQQRYE